ncbi:MAG: transposase [Deltaproteobacteria bacterium]|nr:transposase [Deltaproteobacteria bacterium]
MDLYKNRYRVESARLKEWDYSFNGYYFVTVCTKNQECLFGEVIDSEMILSEIGEIAKQYWLEIPKHFDEAKLDEFVIMPNHVHGIVIIKNDNNVETRHGVSLQQRNQFSKPIPGSLSIIINQYKSSVTRRCRKNGHSNFAWQSRFYDHIIRNENSLQKIREYINNNPIKWDIDENNPAFVKR